ncbi:MAG: alkaline phosphatase family protein [Firmicutes bacterium]|nr:alkaline phosphatase family protein [Bacillota bacterium]
MKDKRPVVLVVMDGIGISKSEYGNAVKAAYMPFWNGNRSEKFDEALEVFEEVPSDKVPFEQRPWMKAAEITDKLIDAVQSGKYTFFRANFPNGDMVGHTGNFAAAIIAVDLCLKRIIQAVDEVGGILIITADHGNVDEMYEKSKDNEVPNAKTAHTLNPVPFIIYDKLEKHEIKEGSFGLANVAPTVVTFFGIKKPDMWEESMLVY